MKQLILRNIQKYFSLLNNYFDYLLKVWNISGIWEKCVPHRGLACCGTNLPMRDCPAQCGTYGHPACCISLSLISWHDFTLPSVAKPGCMYSNTKASNHLVQYSETLHRCRGQRMEWHIWTIYFTKWIHIRNKQSQ